MNYLKITNTGLITTQDLLIFGKSVKRGDENKIGQFGSGLIYALCNLIFRGATPVIFSGETEIKLGKEIVNYRGTQTEMLTVNDKMTNYSIEAGPKWKAWMALREIVSNAIDEKDHRTETVYNPELTGIENKTTIFIPIIDELKPVLRNYDFYFAFERTPYYYNSKGAMYKKNSVSKINIYRKGIRCSDESLSTIFDFDFNFIEIGEDRLASNREVNIKIKEFVLEVKDPFIYLELLKSNINTNNLSENNFNCIKTLVTKNGLKVTTSALRSIGGIYAEGVIISESAYQKLIDDKIITNDLLKTKGGSVYTVVTEVSNKEASLNVEAFVKKCLNYSVKWIKSSNSFIKCENETVLISESYLNIYTETGLKAKIIYNLTSKQLERLVTFL